MTNLYESLKKQPIAPLLLAGPWSFKIEHESPNYVRLTNENYKVTTWKKPTPQGHYLATAWNANQKETDSIIGLLHNCLGMSYDDIRQRYVNLTSPLRQIAA